MSSPANDAREDLIADVPENKDAPCNLCGRGWPYHERACAYEQTARENKRLRDGIHAAVSFTYIDGEAARIRARVALKEAAGWPLTDGESERLASLEPGTRVACADVAKGDGVRPERGEELEAYVARTEGLGVASSLRRASWVMAKPLGEVVSWWNGLTGARGEEERDDGCF